MSARHSRRFRRTSGRAGVPGPREPDVLVLAFNRDVVASLTERFADGAELPEPSAHQARILEWVRGERGSAIVTAVAGSGKSTTLEMVVRRALGVGRPTICTLNGHGFRAWMRYVGRGTTVRVVEHKVRALAKKELGERYGFFGHEVCRLVAMAKAHGIAPQGFTSGLMEDAHYNWHWLLEHHGIDLDADDAFEVIEAARSVLQQDVLQSREAVDFDDQLYLPVIYEARPQRYDWILLDEAQDASAVNRELIRRSLKPGGRLLAVGDRAQAIYGWRGAEIDSLDRIGAEFDCIELPLTVSYRCSRAVVEQARTVYDHIEAAEDALRGDVFDLWRWSTSDLEPGDLVVCRNVAPLVRLLLELQAAGRPAKLLGREQGEDLARLVERVGWSGLEGWRRQAVDRAKAAGRVDRADEIDDRCEAILAILRATPQAKLRAEQPKIIRALFAAAADRYEVVLSTVHKAKGLEADRVWVLDDWRMPSRRAQQEWQQVQEQNLRYVAYTRARRELGFVDWRDFERGAVTQVLEGEADG